MGKSRSHAFENPVPCGRAFSTGRGSIQQNWIQSELGTLDRLSRDPSRFIVLLVGPENRLVSLGSCLGTPNWRLFRRDRRSHGPPVPSAFQNGRNTGQRLGTDRRDIALRRSLRWRSRPMMAIYVAAFSFFDVHV